MTDIVEIATSSLVTIFAAAAVVFGVLQLLRSFALLGTGTFGASGEWQGHVAKFAKNSKQFIDLAFGGDSAKLKSSFEIVLLTAILLVLMGSWMSHSASAKTKAAVKAAAAKKTQETLKKSQSKGE